MLGVTSSLARRVSTREGLIPTSERYELGLSFPRVDMSSVAQTNTFWILNIGYSSQWRIGVLVAFTSQPTPLEFLSNYDTIHIISN